VFNKYYQEELTFLREMGREFAEAHPEAAHMLAAPGADPEVDRLLEGFAFLTGRIREKLDDELPELTHLLIGLLWPHFLRPLPSMSILRFEPKEHVLSESQTIRRGTQVASVPVDGVRTRFQTAYDVEIFPLSLRDARILTPAGRESGLELSFHPHQGVHPGSLGMERLRFFLHGQKNVAMALYFWLLRRLRGVTVRQGGRTRLSLGADAVQEVGFADDEVLLPYPLRSFQGYRFLQEYFALPEKYLFLDLTGLEGLAAALEEGPFEIRFEFDRLWDDALQVSRENLLLYCTPVINLFPHEADPLRVDHRMASYRVRPHGSDAAHYEIFSVDRVSGWDEATGRERSYRPFDSFDSSPGPAGGTGAGRGATFYHTSLRKAVVGRGTETYISFLDEEGRQALPATEVVSIELTCSNRTLPSELRPGDIRIPTDDTPEYVEFRNVSPVTPSIPPPLEGDLFWRLISHLSANYRSMADPGNLRQVLRVYDFPGLYDRKAARATELKLDGIAAVAAEADDYLYEGSVIRGVRVLLELHEDRFASEGDMLLFGAVLREFYALYTSLNAFCRMEIRGTQKGESFSWPPRIGRQSLL